MNRPSPKLLAACSATLLLASGLGRAIQAATDAEVNPGVAQLRHDIGAWDVTTEFLAADGSVTRSVEGSYHFEWVVPDRVVIGRSEHPELGPGSGILYYYRESSNEIEQVSVSSDGHLWVLTGPGDGSVRMSPPTERPDGSTIQLRFTHYNVEPDRFESKMELTRDGGTTWVPGNHQVLIRRSHGEQPGSP